MSKTYLFSVETFKTIGQGALGAMTFGAYHQFVTNRIMELNNENINLKQKYYIDKQLVSEALLRDARDIWNFFKTSVIDLNVFISSPVTGFI